MSNEADKTAFVAGGLSGVALTLLAVLITHGFGLESRGVERGREEVEAKYNNPEALRAKVEAVQKQKQENIKSQHEQVIKMQQDLNSLKKTMAPTACVLKNKAGLKLRAQALYTYQMS